MFGGGLIMKNRCMLAATVLMVLLTGCGEDSEDTGAGPPSTEPLGANQLEDFKAAANKLAMQVRQDTTLLGVADDRFRRLAEQAASNVNYERQAPREAAIAYRLYAAHLLIQPTGQSKLAKAKDGLPWLSRAAKVDRTVGDFAEVQVAERFFRHTVGARRADIDPQDYLRYAMRTAMVEASREQVAEEVTLYMRAARKALTPTAKGGSSPSEDAEYLWNYAEKEGGASVGISLMALRLMLARNFPGKDVGSTRPSSINVLPNGNTLVRYRFVGREPIELEWEVSKAKGLVVPRNKWARWLMTMDPKELKLDGK